MVSWGKDVYSALLVCCPAEARAPAWTVSSTAWWPRWEVKDWGKDVIEGVGGAAATGLRS